jgi:peptidoglycan hydrolase-like protein with peptidoglycan-binding domain
VLSRRRLLLAGLGVVVLALAGSALALRLGVDATSARMRPDPTALTRVVISGAGGRLASVRAVDAHGTAIPVTVRGGRVFPKSPLTVGEKVVVTATVSRTAPVGWVLGSSFQIKAAVRTPRVRISARSIEVPAGSSLKLEFAAPVARVSLRSGTHRTLRSLPADSRSLTLPGSVSGAGARTVLVSAVARSWETLPAPVQVTWFAAGDVPKLVATPRPGAAGLQPGAPLRLTLSRPIAEVFGTRLPRITPPTPGHWTQIDANTLAFVPKGSGFGLDAKIKVVLPRAVQLAGRAKATTSLTFSGALGSTLRLQQLLANLGYLPVQFVPSGKDAAKTVAAQQAAALKPPAGRFRWVWVTAPNEIRKLWRPGFVTSITQGAVMSFQAQHGLVPDGFAGPLVWHELIGATIAGRTNPAGYSYVLVRKHTPQSITVWHDGYVIVSGPSNTGIPEAPTPEGTFPVFQRLTSQTMTGTNPDGTAYHDAGIKWISYFHGNDAIHGFNRSSYGSPQSLGCVELPVTEAARVYPYTPIGTLVTIAP